MRGGRPSTYTPEVAALICERTADGESLRQICRTEGMPSRTAVWKWLDTFPEFNAQYAHAREAQADSHADDITAIADDESIPSDSRRIRVDARKWIASKLKPRRYGERQEIEHKGALTVTIAATDANL